MKSEEFDAQFARLSDQWPNSYSATRKAAFWKVFESVDPNVFTDAITDCLLRYRQAPMIEELQDSVTDAERRFNASRMASNASPLSALRDAAEKSKTPGYAKMCVNAIQYKIEKGLDSESDEWKAILKTLDAVAKDSISVGTCKYCNNSGLIFSSRPKHGNEYECAYRCFCDAGKKHLVLTLAPRFSFVNAPKKQFTPPESLST